VFEASTGVPFTPGFAGDALGVKSIDPNIDVPSWFPPRAAARSSTMGIQTLHQNAMLRRAKSHHVARQFGANTLIGPGLINLDTSLLKNSQIKANL